MKLNQTALNKAFQFLVGSTPDGIIGPQTEAAYQKVRHPDWPATLFDQRSPAFLAFMPFLLEWEGQTFENDPNDPGGPTKFGIDQKSHPGVDIRNLTKEQATDIYWEEWQADGCGMMASPYAEVFFNCAVNMGLSRAKEFDQKAGGSAARFLDFQDAKYLSLAESSAKMKAFLKGWFNRTAALRKRFDL